MKKQRSRFSWPLFLFGLPFALLGLIALGFAIWQLSSHLRAQSWEEHRAVLESISDRTAKRHGMSSARTTRLEGRYRYSYANQEYVSERLAFSLAYAAGLDDWDEAIAAELGEPGSSITIWVNPADPAESVAIRDMRWGEFGAYLLFMFGMGGGGAFFLHGAFTSHRPRPTTPGKPPRVKLKTVIVMWLLTPLFGMLAWMLWRDGHPVWAGLVALQLPLTLNASYQYVVQRGVSAR